MKRLFAFLTLFTLFLAACGERDTTYDNFAQCIADSGTTYYGAFWCHNCETQAELFGDSKDLLPYVECAQGGKDAQVALCEREEIGGYPTWEFPDGTRESGVQSLEALSEATSCPLPGEESIMMQ